MLTTQEVALKTPSSERTLDIPDLVFNAILEERSKYQNQILSKISMLDFYLEKSYKKKYISEKLCQKKCNEFIN